MTTATVIGAGLAGLAAALRLAEGGCQVTLLSKGLGGLPLSPGTVDVLGYTPERTVAPLAAAAALAKAQPTHPYAAIGLETVKTGLDWLRGRLPDLLTGDPAVNVVLPTAVGALRPTCLFQPSMAAGDLGQGRSLARLGPRPLKDLTPELCAANLARQTVDGRPIHAQAYRIDLPARPGEADSSALNYARALDQADYRRTFAAAVKAVIGDEDAVGLPALLGLADRTAWREVEALVGRPVFEIPLPPPSVPGLRLDSALTAAAKAAGVRFVLGSKVVGATAEGSHLVSVKLHQAGRDQAWTADEFVYAPGGFESGALALDSHGRLAETVFRLPLTDAGGAAQGTAADLDRLITGDYWHDQGLFAVGVAVDPAMRPVDSQGRPVFGNLRAVGSLLAGATRWSEKSGEGIAVGSAVAAADAILKGR
ncbi:MAG: glycerol-3-phosphate dehydrogenase subunit GlpB [Propionibacteriaceae bacterium]|jgi:glycerol-3-phosphate dehydrogenase subunit B|nr:glycerol-3-phosphate dehydrogenase subunit GlpB [Propionibacteriaceae bacterium]